MLRTVLIASATYLTACGVIPGIQKNHSSNSDSWEYEFEENGCSTGKLSGNGRSSQCEALKDDARNNHCAFSMRKRVYESLCDEGDAKHPDDQGGFGSSSPTPTPTPTANTKACGYEFDSIEDSTIFRAVLRGVWISRSTEIFSEHAIDENRSYKQGFYFDFTAGEMSEVRIYHELNGSDLRPVAMSVPATGSAIRISQPVTSGIYAGWHLVQWETERDRCATIAVGLERRRDELVDTLMVIGPKMFWSSNSDSTRSIEDFFKDPTNRRRDFLNYGMNPLPKWK